MIPSNTQYQFPYHIMTHQNVMIQEPANLLPEYNQKPIPVIKVKPQLDANAINAQQYQQGAIPVFDVYGVK